MAIINEDGLFKKGLKRMIAKTGVLWGILLGAGIGYVCQRKKRIRIEQEMSEQVERYKNLYQVFYLWFLVRDSGRKAVDYFIENRIDHVAIYGYGLAGQKLAAELTENGLIVEYVIDQKTNITDVHIPLYSPDETLPTCSMVIVTASGFGQIRKLLSTKVSCPIVLLTDVLEVIHNQTVRNKNER